MEKFLLFVQAHAHHAHWYLFGAALLAGINIPISIDLLIILGATLAATVVTVSPVKLFLFLLFGCIFSAWICYGLGRGFGALLLKWPFFSAILTPARMEKVRKFYAKRGSLTFFLCRFIPFGVRNALFMSCGISHLPFSRFVLWDSLACTLWCSLSFFTYYALGENIDILYNHLKIINLFLLAACVGAAIGLIWYKRRKHKQTDNV